MSDEPEDDGFQMTPEFFEEASAVIQSPYFAVPDIEDGKKQVAAAEKLFEEKRRLRDALAKCRDYEDLEGEAKAIYDRAKAEIG